VTNVRTRGEHVHKLSSQGYKGMLPTQTTTKGFQLP
jgi:hypothetical protein